MNSGLKQKFSMLAIFAGALVAIVSLIGYYTAHTNLSETLESEISAAVESQGKDLRSPQSTSPTCSAMSATSIE